MKEAFNFPKKLYCVLLILWMALIFYFSHQPVNESGQLSGSISNTIANNIENVFKFSPDRNLLEHIIRKCAHFTEYMILGILMYTAFSKNNVLGGKIVSLCLILCILYAAGDEIHQIFVPGRGARITDVLIDSIGAAVGVCGIRLINIRYTKFK